MKNGKIWKVIYTVLFLLQVVAEALSLTAILRLNMLPGKYTAAVIAVFVLGLVLTGGLLFIPARKGSGNMRRIIACLLAAVIIGLCFFAFSVVSKVHDTMDDITDNQHLEQTGTTRQIFVLQEDPAKDLEDARGYVFGLVENYDTTNTEGALTAIAQQLGEPVQTLSFTTVHDMVNALYNGTCRAIILNGGYLSLLEDEAGFGDVRDRIRILCDVQVLLPEKPEQPAEPEKSDGPSEPSGSLELTTPTQPEEPNDITTTPFILYISGLDSQGSKLYVTRSDVNILVVVNPNTKQILLLNTPRDYYVPNPGGDGAMDKLAHCSVYGLGSSVKVLNDLYDIELDYYAQINFTGFKTLVDAVGGVEVYSTASFTAGDVTIQKGYNYLDGEKALVFARERKSLPGGDNDRGKNQMKIIKALLTKATSGTTIITNYAQILESLGGMFVTSMSSEEISALVRMQLDDMASWNIQSYAVTGNCGMDSIYSAPGFQASVMYQDAGRIAFGQELIRRVMAGEILTEEDVKYTR